MGGFDFEDEEKQQMHFMFGAVEAFFEHGHRCHSLLGPEDRWEERYLSKCLLHIGVHMDTFPDLLEDESCNGGKHLLPCAANAVAFHPLRKLTEYQTCRQDALGHKQLFCVTVMRSHSDHEVDLMREQFRLGS